MKQRIAVLDDEERMVAILRMVLDREGYDTHGFARAADFYRAHERQPFDLLLTDLKMPDADGLAVLHRMRSNAPAVPVILITAHATVASAVAAMRDGAFDYLPKPFDNDELKALVRRALELTRLGRANRYLRSELRSRYAPDGLIGQSPAMLEVLARCRRIAESPSTVLITGESGTGKELIARLIHYQSGRVDGPFVAVNCTAFADGVLESELFGHERGAFTGALAARQGVFERAHGGTLFLDEIGEVGEGFQAKLLRVVQEREVTRVGSSGPRAIDIRLIAATQRDLGAEVAAGRFREDFYYRLAVIPIHLPPLRERREDILPLANHFFARRNAELGRRLRGFAPEVVRWFETYEWPGNVRELENAVERGVVLADGELVTLDAIGVQRAAEPVAAVDDALVGAAGGLQVFLDRAAADFIRHTLREAGGVKHEAARRLGIDRTTLFRLARKYGLSSDAD